MAYNAASIVMGGRRTGSRLKKKSSQPRKAKAKVKVKIKGTPEQVAKAVRKLANGVSGGQEELDKGSNQASRLFA